MSPALSDLPFRKVTRALESVGFGYVRTKGSHASTATRTGGWSSSRSTAPSSAALCSRVADEEIARSPCHLLTPRSLCAITLLTFAEHLSTKMFARTVPVGHGRSAPQRRPCAEFPPPQRDRQDNEQG